MEEREQARAAKDFARADEIRDRAWRRWAGKSAIPPTGRRLVPKADGQPDHLREAAGPGGGAGEAAGAPGLAGAGDGCGRSWSGCVGRRTTRASSPRSIPTPTAIRGGLLRRDDALLIALDQVQDPRNLGAVCRSAEFAGATGVIVPERRSAAVTAATCKASAGAVEHLADRPRPQPRRLAGGGQGGRLLDLGRRRRGQVLRLGRRPQRPDRARARRRGQRHPAAGGDRLRRAGLASPARRGRVAERLRGGHGAALRGRAPAR